MHLLVLVDPVASVFMACFCLLVTFGPAYRLWADRVRLHQGLKYVLTVALVTTGVVLAVLVMTDQDADWCWSEVCGPPTP